MKKDNNIELAVLLYHCHIFTVASHKKKLKETGAWYSIKIKSVTQKNIEMYLSNIHPRGATCHRPNAETKRSVILITETRAKLISLTVICYIFHVIRQMTVERFT